ncbi:MAG TPA: DUF58 domain-containing protein [Acidimicrobiales bacterium]|nr:DUF58 domain-containing protein [Acidimicrobiales bacterium]
MLTRHGVAATIVSVALVLAGRLFAVFELFVVGAGGAALVVAAVAFTGLTRLRLDVARALQPARVHAGQVATVSLSVANRSRRRTPVLELRDAVGGRRTASVVLSPLASEERVDAAYALPGERRGVVEIGPLVVRLSDPFGLAALTAPAAPVTELTVWPAVEAVLAPPGRSTRRADEGAVATPASAGDEFYALRPYADGDDLRRVHWRASARRDDLVIRQDEQPGQGRVTIALDTRPGVYRAQSFERAVSAAASIAVATERSGVEVRLVTTAGHDSRPPGPVRDSGDLVDVLDHLAVVELRDGGHLPTVVATAARGGTGGGGVVVITGDGQPHNVPKGGAAGGQGSPLVVVMAAGRAAAAGGGTSVVVDESTALAPVWNRAVSARRGLARL